MGRGAESCLRATCGLARASNAGARTEETCRLSNPSLQQLTSTGPWSEGGGRGALTRFHSGRLPASLGRGPFLFSWEKLPFAGERSGRGARAFRDLPGRGGAAAAGGSVGGWGADVAAPFPFPFHQVICDG